ncbi:MULTISPECIES: hypothetical protein [Pseudomonas]|jgi:Lon protease-like protein|uniref:hypothetical protein n=1 Tax=Pseudomonas TaxID=286 RepID=UPI0030031A3F
MTYKHCDIFESRLASQCQGIACCLSYNSERAEGEAKHTLIEAAMCLDRHAVRVHRKKDGLLLINARGKSRFATLRERVAIWLLKGKLEIRP